ncbi:excalibur calcium-binding domain-containing protein [Halobacillus massiliensis]|uniref:excalibur calcium-binding domain-containing protein n=1 Tax=Halobacillus massiliensis TaxID=1926286 RepID=UPI0009E47B31|nr:excalibur calcium-binding domain-containing protein [Halobacillus massiliensis]
MTLFFLGFLALIVSLIYLIYHFGMKIKKKESTLSKKLFYPLLFGGLVLMIFSFSSLDETNALQLQDELKKNEELLNEIKTLKDEKEELIVQAEELNATKKELEDELASNQETLSSNSAELEKLKNSAKEYEGDKEELNKEIDDLTSKIEDQSSLISELEEEKSSLQAQVEDLETTTVSTNEDSSNTSITGPLSSNAYFENCDAAKAAGAAPVRRGDPGYAKHLDRDGDGIGCEW